jgi:hypothetical protein
MGARIAAWSVGTSFPSRSAAIDASSTPNDRSCWQRRVAVGGGRYGIGLCLLEIALGDGVVLPELLVEIRHALRLHPRGLRLPEIGDGRREVRRRHERQRLPGAHVRAGFGQNSRHRTGDRRQYFVDTSASNCTVPVA